MYRQRQIKCGILFMLFIGSTTISFAQNGLTLSESLETAAIFLRNTLPDGTKVAVFNFSSNSPKLTNHIIDGLTIALVNAGMDVFDRKNLDEVNKEIYYGFSGAVDDNTAQLYGHDVGVQTVVLGSFKTLGGNLYQLNIQAIAVETKRVQNRQGIFCTTR
jgi:hypothetical protein